MVRGLMFWRKKRIIPKVRAWADSSTVTAQDPLTSLTKELLFAASRLGRIAPERSDVMVTQLVPDAARHLDSDVGAFEATAFLLFQTDLYLYSKQLRHLQPQLVELLNRAGAVLDEILALRGSADLLYQRLQIYGQNQRSKEWFFNVTELFNLILVAKEGVAHDFRSGRPPFVVVDAVMGQCAQALIVAWWMEVLPLFLETCALPAFNCLSTRPPTGGVSKESA